MTINDGKCGRCGSKAVVVTREHRMIRGSNKPVVAFRCESCRAFGYRE
jgi:uncharacterized protein YlaI